MATSKHFKNRLNIGLPPGGEELPINNPSGHSAPLTGFKNDNPSNKLILIYEAMFYPSSVDRLELIRNLRLDGNKLNRNLIESSEAYDEFKIIAFLIAIDNAY
ncbi:hypothetical protein TNCV_1929361 [Trichonephila clavipes]|nr:hypothetical protein TNCV_1929361 [Trichonephila clavipes]